MAHVALASLAAEHPTVVDWLRGRDPWLLTVVGTLFFDAYLLKALYGLPTKRAALFAIVGSVIALFCLCCLYCGCMVAQDIKDPRPTPLIQALGLISLGSLTTCVVKSVVWQGLLDATMKSSSLKRTVLAILGSFGVGMTIFLAPPFPYRVLDAKEATAAGDRIGRAVREGLERFNERHHKLPNGPSDAEFLDAIRPLLTVDEDDPHWRDKRQFERWGRAVYSEVPIEWNPTVRGVTLRQAGRWGAWIARWQPGDQVFEMYFDAKARTLTVYPYPQQ
jgi:hypothetical protein